MFIRKSVRSLAFSASLVSLLSTAAQAQTPAGIATQQQASSGATNVAKEGFEAATTNEGEEKDTTSFRVMAGGLWTQGNTETLALTGSADFRLRRRDSQLSAVAAVNHARSPNDDGDVEATVDNYQGRVRYDYFVSGALATFFSVSGRRDRFQDLDLRLNIDPGLAYYFFDEEAMQLWGEVGYDLQYDIREGEAIDSARAANAMDPTNLLLDKTETRHSGRVFVGYVHQMNSAVSLDSNVEYIQAFSETKNYRINAGVGVTSQLVENLSIALSFTVRYDNNPLEGVEKTDTLTAYNLVYTF